MHVGNRYRLLEKERQAPLTDVNLSIDRESFVRRRMFGCPAPARVNDFITRVVHSANETRDRPLFEVVYTNAFKWPLFVCGDNCSNKLLGAEEYFRGSTWNLLVVTFSLSLSFLFFF